MPDSVTINRNEMLYEKCRVIYVRVFPFMKFECFFCLFEYIDHIICTHFSLFSFYRLQADFGGSFLFFSLNSFVHVELTFILHKSSGVDI